MFFKNELAKSLVFVIFTLCCACCAFEHGQSHALSCSRLIKALHINCARWNAFLRLQWRTKQTALRGGKVDAPSQRQRKRSSRTENPRDKMFTESKDRKQRWKEIFSISEDEKDLSSEWGFSDQPDIYKPPPQTQPGDVRHHCKRFFFICYPVANDRSSLSFVLSCHRNNRRKTVCPNGLIQSTTTTTPRSTCTRSLTLPLSRKQKPRP
jgi:hypothetical protein